MEQFYTPSLFLGLFRLGLFVLFVIVLYWLTAPKFSKTTNSNFASFIYYICAIVPVCFVLIQLNSFDRFTILFFIFGFIAFRAIDLRWGVPLNDQLTERKERILLYFLKLTDTNASFSGWLKTTFFQKINIQRAIKKVFRKNVLIKYGIPIVIFIAAYISRVYFIYYDTYTLSDIWYNNLLIVKGLGGQNLLSNQEMMIGEFALISLYKQITEISSSMALQTFGFLESGLLSVSIFWGTSKITRTRWFPGLIAALGFIFLYGFLLIDIATITKHRSVFLALAIAIPVFAMVLLPKILSQSKRRYFFKMLVLFGGIAFIDLFVTLVVLPFFLLFALPCIPKRYKYFYIKALLAFGISLALVLCLHVVASYYDGGSFSEFLYSNLYSVSSYTYLPQLVLPYSEFIVYVQYIAMGGFILVLPLWFRNKEKWYPLMALSLLFVSLTLLIYAKNIFFDTDLLKQVICVFVPMSLAVLVWVISYLIKTILRSKESIPAPYPLLIVILLVGSLGFWQQKKSISMTKRNLVIENVLNTYNTIESTYLPYSYAIVNNGSSAPFSIDSHYFISYNYFNSKYLDIDAIYAKHKTDKAFLKENPNVILPKSTFIFLYSEDAMLNTKNGISKDDQKQARENLSILKKRGRPIELFYKGKHVQVYEIINEANAGNINDLLSKNNSREIL